MTDFQVGFPFPWRAFVTVFHASQGCLRRVACPTLRAWASGKAHAAAPVACIVLIVPPAPRGASRRQKGHPRCAFTWLAARWPSTGRPPGPPCPSGRGSHAPSPAGGLCGVMPVISDAHGGVKATLSGVLGAMWRRCRVHCMRSALAYAGKSGRRVASAFIATAFAGMAHDVGVDPGRRGGICRGGPNPAACLGSQTMALARDAASTRAQAGPAASGRSPRLPGLAPSFGPGLYPGGARMPWQRLSRPPVFSDGLVLVPCRPAHGQGMSGARQGPVASASP